MLPVVMQSGSAWTRLKALKVEQSPDSDTRSRLARQLFTGLHPNTMIAHPVAVHIIADIPIDCGPLAS